MNRNKKAQTGSRDARQGTQQIASKNKKTPNADMQSEDAGSADSGESDPGTAAQSAMKQTSKTDAERGSQR